MNNEIQLQSKTKDEILDYTKKDPLIRYSRNYGTDEQPEWVLMVQIAPYQHARHDWSNLVFRPTKAK